MKKNLTFLTKFELCLWLFSLVTVSCAFLFSPSSDYLTLIASLIGVTALLFVAKGYVLGQILTVIFSIFYGIISFYFGYYGEMITYLLMTAPMAILTVITWVRNPFQKSGEVAVRKMTRGQILLMFFSTAIVTFLFYFILKGLHTTNLFVSTVSIATSFLASYMTFMRSPYYALGYAANDIVLIILWFYATLANISYLPMVICFVLFFLNDVYGFINWQRMHKRQHVNA